MSEADDGQRVIGRLVLANTAGVSGWAVAADGETTAVEIRINDVPVASVTADRPRPTLHKRGKVPLLRCGFDWRPDEASPLAVGDRVEVRRVADGATLPGSPARIRRAPATTSTRGRRRSRSSATESNSAAAGSILTDKTKVRIATDRDIAALPQIPLLPPANPRGSSAIFAHSTWAFFLRELRSRYSEYRLGYLWAIAQPLAYLLVIRQMRSALTGGGSRDDVMGVSYTFYLALGILPYFMWQHAFHRAMGAMNSFKGMYAYRQLKPIDVVVARVAIEVLTIIVLMSIVFTGMWWFDVDIQFEDPLRYAAILGLLIVMSFGVGLLADVYVSRDREVRQVFQLFERPLFFISGVFFTAASMPEGIRWWLMWNPLLHAIDLGRESLLRQYDSPCSWWYLTLCAFSLLALGLAAYRKNLSELSQ